MAKTLKPEVAAKIRERQQAAGRELLPALILTQDGKRLEGEPEKGRIVIRPNLQRVEPFWDFEAVIKALAAAWPACTFEWGK